MNDSSSRSADWEEQLRWWCSNNQTLSSPRTGCNFEYLMTRRSRKAGVWVWVWEEKSLSHVLPKSEHSANQVCLSVKKMMPSASVIRSLPSFSFTLPFLLSKEIKNPFANKIEECAIWLCLIWYVNARRRKVSVPSSLRGEAFVEQEYKGPAESFANTFCGWQD